MIYLSTASFKKLSGYEVLEFFKDNNIRGAELSAGKYSKNQEKLIYKIKGIKKIIHNYFPPPKNPFVINIASHNKKILKRSLNFIKNSILISKKIGANDYSFHPGFVTDISPKEIGVVTKNVNFFDRKKSLQILLNSLEILSAYAKKQKIRLLLENNVMKKSSFDYLGKDTTLMSDPSEIKYVMEKSPSNVNLLLDVAHLKVSSNVLGFNKEMAFHSIKKWIRAFHLSDNDGWNDTNDIIKRNSWFFKFINLKKIRFISIEVYKEDINILKNQIRILNKFLKNKVND